VTLWPLTFWPSLVSDHTWRVTWPIPPANFKILQLSILEWWVLTSPIGCHWQCVCSHCACAVSRDLCVGAHSPHTFKIPDRDFPIQYTTLWCYTIKTNGVIRQNNVWPVLKTTQLSAHAQNHVNLEFCCKYFTTILFGDHYFPLTASNFGNLTALRATFSRIFTAHAQTRLFLNIRLKFWVISPFDSVTPISL